jgi:linoleate 8R-lipoxygenase/9,12-octadecadienoate 8-hydroperoxide 8R-isomerase
LKNILNFNRTESSWTLDPRANFDHVFDQTTVIPSAMGNQISVEFNLIYRWHACVSKRDEKWTEDFFKHNLNFDDPDKLNVEQLKMLMKNWEHSIPQDPAQREFGGFKRQLDGKFSDQDLVDELTKSTEDIAGNQPICWY